MGDIQWTDNFSVGIDSIDRQHRRLVELNDQLFQAIMNDKGMQVVMTVLEELTEYAVSHFDYEEALLNQFGFNPVLLAEHIEEHRSLAAQVQDYIRDLETRNSLDLKVYDFLRNWISNHLKETDSQYALFLQKHGVQ